MTNYPCPSCGSQLSFVTEDAVKYIFCAAGKCKNPLMNNGAVISHGDINAAYENLCETEARWNEGE